MPQQRKPSIFSLLFYFKRNAANIHKFPESGSLTDLRGDNTFDVSMKLESFVLEEYKHTSSITI